MNDFEKRISALRLQFKAEREMIQKDTNRTIGRLNTAIGQVASAEAREALRAEKARIYENTRRSMKYNRACYHQQLDALLDQYQQHLQKHGSKKQLRYALARVSGEVSAKGEKSITISFGNNQAATITFG